MESARFTLKKRDGEADGLKYGLISRFSPFMADFSVISSGNFYSIPDIDDKNHKKAVIGSVVPMGHIPAGLNMGHIKKDILMFIKTMSIYAGFQAILQELFAANKVFGELNLSE